MFEYGASKEDVKAAMSKTREFKKASKKLLESTVLSDISRNTALDLMLKKALGQVVDWSRVDKSDYLLAMERSPIKDVEIKHLLKAALTSEVNDRTVYMKGIDASYHYEGYATYKAEEIATDEGRESAEMEDEDELEP